jgi:hypothetical protein
MMKDYIGKILHQDVNISAYEDIRKLPLAYQRSYELNKMTIGVQEALVAAPKDKIHLTTLRRHQRQMTIYTGLPCVLYLKDINYYARDTMLEEGIPFIWEGHQIYLPFIGILLDDHRERAIVSSARISFLTQKLLLTALYQCWQNVTVTKAAEKIGVSKMSITRCFNEIEALNLPYLTVRGRARTFTADTDKRKMWETLQGVLRNPVIRTYAMRKEPNKVLPMSGTMALAHYSTLDEGPYPILAMTKKDLPEIKITAYKLIPAGEVPGCVIQKLGYQILFEGGEAVDPLTTVLTISEEERFDPRVSMAIDEMLERYVW